jgi:ABC-type Mn2+/Zn2+ transport system ATPase subunit
MSEHVSARIKSFQVASYRSCQNTVFSPDPQLSALIGINGSGKTNLLNAMVLIRKIHSTRHYRSHSKASPNICKLNIDFSLGDKQVRYQADVDYAANERNMEEVLNAQEQWNIKDLTGKDEWLHFPSYLLRPGISEEPQRLAEYLIMRSIESQDGPTRKQFEELTNTSKGILDSLEPISHLLSRISYYSASQYTNPSECPAYFSLEEDDDHSLPRFRPYSSKGPHTRFLHDLYKFKVKNPQGFEEFESIAGPKGLGLVDKITFHVFPVPTSEIEVRTGGTIVKKKIRKVIVVPHFIIRKTKLCPGQLSEGTFKTLAVLLYLGADASELLLLEEPEVCIHHGLLHSLVELIKTHSMHKQIIISTHSDSVLDQLSPENVFLVRNVPRKGTVVDHLPKSMSAKNYLALKMYLTDAGNLGEYWKDAGFS